MSLSLCFTPDNIRAFARVLVVMAMYIPMSYILISSTLELKHKFPYYIITFFLRYVIVEYFLLYVNNDAFSAMRNSDRIVVICYSVNAFLVIFIIIWQSASPLVKTVLYFSVFDLLTGIYVGLIDAVGNILTGHGPADKIYPVEPKDLLVLAAASAGTFLIARYCKGLLSKLKAVEIRRKVFWGTAFIVYFLFSLVMCLFSYNDMVLNTIIMMFAAEIFALFIINYFIRENASSYVFNTRRLAMAEMSSGIMKSQIDTIVGLQEEIDHQIELIDRMKVPERAAIEQIHGYHASLLAASKDMKYTVYTNEWHINALLNYYDSSLRSHGADVSTDLGGFDQELVPVRKFEECLNYILHTVDSGAKRTADTKGDDMYMSVDVSCRTTGGMTVLRVEASNIPGISISRMRMKKILGKSLAKLKLETKKSHFVVSAAVQDR